MARYVTLQFQLVTDLHVDGSVATADCSWALPVPYRYITIAANCDKYPPLGVPSLVLCRYADNGLVTNCPLTIPFLKTWDKQLLPINIKYTYTQLLLNANIQKQTLSSSNTVTCIYDSKPSQIQQRAEFKEGKKGQTFNYYKVETTYVQCKVCMWTACMFTCGAWDEYNHTLSEGSRANCMRPFSTLVMILWMWPGRVIAISCSSSSLSCRQRFGWSTPFCWKLTMYFSILIALNQSSTVSNSRGVITWRFVLDGRGGLRGLWVGEGYVRVESQHGL